MRAISIAGHRVGPGAPVLVVAEAGVNHNGDPALAEQLVDAAAEAGADAVKFQAFAADRVAGPSAPKAAYQQETTAPAESQVELLRGLELGSETFRALQERAEARGIVFLASAFDEASVDLLAELDVPAFKIGSGELTNWPLLERIAAHRRPVILSTGMADLEEVHAAVRVLRDGGSEDVVLLHCVSSYPADTAESNLRAIATLRETLDVPAGYSDHTPGVETAVAAVALGAAMLEKHLTLDRSLPGPDQRASLEPDAFSSYVAAVRLVEQALGDGVKVPTPSELETRAVVRRSLVAAGDLPAGTVLESSMLGALRPGTGISPAERAQVLGRRLKRGLRSGEQLAWSDLEH